jgi:type II secretory pathway component PulC
MILTILKKYIWVINLILLAGLSYATAQIVNDRIREKVSPQASAAMGSSKVFSTEENVDNRINQLSSRSSYNVILKRNVFGLRYTSLGPGALDPNSVPQTTLNLELLGTVLEPGVKSKAVIKNLDTGKIRGYSEGELVDIIVSESVKLAKIENCVAIVERAEGPETIRCKKDTASALTSSSQSGQGFASNRTRRGRGGNVSTEDTATSQSEADGVRQVAEGIYEIDQKMLNDALGNPNQLLTQARAIPQEDGLRFFAVAPNSIFFKIGIRNGDVIHSINNVELDNIENAFAVFEDLKRQPRFIIEISRGGQDFTYQYTVK